MDSIRLRLGDRIAELRRRCLLTQSEVAARAGMSTQGVKRLERGRLTSLPLPIISRYLRAVGASWSELTDVLDQLELPEVGPDVPSACS